MAQQFAPEVSQGYEQNSHARLADLCMPKSAGDGKTWLPIEDDAFEEISDLLLNIGHKESWSRRPRTYAVLRMMNAVPHMDAFETHGLNDTSFPYRTKRDLPPELQSVDMSDLFLWYQKYVLCDACDLEKDREVRHISVKDGEKLFRWHNKLGKGQSGDVDKVESRMTGKIYARKRIKRHREMRKEKEAFRRFETELAALKRLNHEHLVRVHGSYTDDKYVAILMSPVADYNLKQYLQEPVQKADMPTFRRWYGCLANAIAYLKDMEIRHKDIKPENILVKGKAIFLSDFGTAWDWSDSKFADSVTKGKLEDFTPRYASPEVMTTGSKSRRSSSDIWSLGIVFLEMTTILRGKTLKDYETYLARNGSRSGYPSENWVSVNNWLEQLIPYYPRTDNEPLQWIKEMIKIDPTTRPKARDLSAQISQAMNGAWCGHCCNDEDSTESITTSDYESQHGDLPNDINEPTVVQQQQHDPIYTASATPASITTAEPLTLVKTQSLLESHFSPGETMGQRMMTNFLDSLDQAEIPAPADMLGGPVQPIQPVHTSIPIESALQSPTDNSDHQIHVKRRTGPVGLFDKVKDLLVGHRETEPSSLRPKDKEAKIGDEPPTNRLDAQGKLGDEEPFTDINLDPSLAPIPSVECDNQDLAFVSDPLVICGTSDQTATLNAQFAISGVVAVPNDSLAIPEKLRVLADKSVVPDIILDTWRSWAQVDSHGDSTDRVYDRPHVLVRTRSYEDLSRQTESILEDRILGQPDSERRASDDFTLPEYSKVNSADFDNIKKELKEFKPDVKWSIPVVPKVSIESIEESDPKHQAPQDPSTIIEQIIPGEEIAPVGEFVPHEKVVSHEEIVPLEENPPPAYSPAKIEANSLFTRNPLKDSLNQARGKNPPPPSGNLLTAKNLSSLNTESSKPTRVKVDLQTASVYMKRIHDDAASSVATSMVSTRTRERLKLAGLMLPLQDRSCRYMEQYCKEGKAGAVRLLLESGCEPGTVKRRRPGPIFNAVRGATMRHLKCVDALIAKGVNVNVKSRSNGRTPLHYAIEHEAWPGYMRLIYTLLKAGADPNIKDATGDVPLLQILYGGVEPLAEHKRDALAILLTNNFNTDLGVSPPATKNTPLHLAVMHQDPWAVALLLNREVAVNKKNVAELTPLQLAAGSWSNPLSEDQMEILELLLERNAKVNVKDEGTGQTPIHTAILLELDQVLQKLIASGGDINQKDHSGRSALDLFEDQKLKHNSGRVCKKCVKVQHVMNETIFPGGFSGTGDESAGFQKHNVLFAAGVSVVL